MAKIHEQIFEVYAGINPASVIKEMVNEIETNFHTTEEEFREDYESGRKYIVEINLLGYTPVRKITKTRSGRG